MKSFFMTIFRQRQSTRSRSGTRQGRGLTTKKTKDTRVWSCALSQRIAALLAVLILGNPHASAQDSLCQPLVAAPRREFVPRLQPSYWITVAPSGDYLAYMTVQGNFLIDTSPTSIGAVLVAPGKVDLQFSADEKYFTLVNKHASDAKRISFGVPQGTSWYSFPGLLGFFDKSKLFNEPVWDGLQHPEKARRINPIAIDRTFYNHYHSMAVYKDENGQEWHRILNDLKGASFRDYRWDNGVPQPSDIAYITSGAPLIDQYGNSFIDLPMLSRDGVFFAGFNRQTMTTQIFGISKKRERRLVTDLGMETGKLAFSYPDPASPFLYVAFHVDYVSHEEGNKMTGTILNQAKDVLVIKLRRFKDNDGEESLEKVSYAMITQTGVLGEGNYYPQWSKNGQLYYVEVKRAGPGKTYRFIQTDPQAFPFRRFDLPQKFSSYATSCGRRQFHSMVALGATWAQHCSQFAAQLTAADAAIYAMGLRGKTCDQAAAAWMNDKQGILAYQRLFALRTPHHIAGYIRPDGRWTQKAEKSLELVAERNELAALKSEDLSKVCNNDYDTMSYICPDSTLVQ